MALGERLFLNATVLTVDPDRPRATAVGVVGDRIGFIGDTGGARAWARAGAEEIDLGGACLVPGFVEAHNHMISFGLGLAEVDVRPEAAPSVAALVAAVAERARQTPPGRWVLARGYDDNQLTERRHPTRADLDAATSEHPVLVVNGSAHMSVANSLALQLGGVTSGTSDPQGGTSSMTRRASRPGCCRKRLKPSSAGSFRNQRSPTWSRRWRAVTSAIYGRGSPAVIRPTSRPAARSPPIRSPPGMRGRRCERR